MALSSMHYWNEDDFEPKQEKPLEQMVTAEPVVAWRMWRVERPQTLTLDPALADHLADVYDRGGNPFKGLFGARLGAVGSTSPWNAARLAGLCNRGSVHEAPHRNCSCGIWAVKDKDMLWDVVRNYRRAGCPIAFGKVQMWGRWYEHEKGYRAQYARPYDVEVVGGDEATVAELRSFYSCDVRLIDEPEETKVDLDSGALSGLRFISTNVNPLMLSGWSASLNPYLPMPSGNPVNRVFTFRELLRQFTPGTYPTLERASLVTKPARNPTIEWLSNKHKDAAGNPSHFKNHCQILRTPFNPKNMTADQALADHFKDIEWTLVNGQPNAQIEGGYHRRFCGGYRYYLGRALKKRDRLVLRPLREPLLRGDTGSGFNPPWSEWISELSLEVHPA